MMQTIRLGILGSSNGTNMLKLIEAIENGRLNASIEVVVSNKADALILTRAQDHNLPAIYLDPKGCTRESYDQMLSSKLKEFNLDLIVLIGYMRVLSNAFTDQWQNKMINVHPSLLPDFAGGMDRQVHQAVLNAGRQETGCTVHFVTEIVDGGPIVVQKRCPVLPEDTVESLRTRVQALESVAIIESIQKIQEKSYYDSRKASRDQKSVDFSFE